MSDHLILMLRGWIVSRRTWVTSSTSAAVVALVTTALGTEKVLTLHLALREQMIRLLLLIKECLRLTLRQVI